MLKSTCYVFIGYFAIWPSIYLSGLALGLKREPGTKWRLWVIFILRELCLLLLYIVCYIKLVNCDRVRGSQALPDRL